MDSTRKQQNTPTNPLNACLEFFTEQLPELPVPGLYAFFSQTGDCIYIGQSGDLRKRVGTHRRTKEWAKNAAVMYWPGFADVEDRLVAETILILRERPRYNQMIKLGLTKDGRLYEAQFTR